MKTEELILAVAKKKHQFKASDVLRSMTEENKVARTYLSSVLTAMVKSGRLSKDGSGRWSTYSLPEFADNLGKRIKKRYKNSGLEEHEILDQILSEKPFLGSLKENVQSIFSYAFSEMVNNAIEHSQSKNIETAVAQIDGDLEFTVRDTGVGVFRNVMRERGLHSELEAIQDLLKGKTTTAPRAHSGEGIFFTSKAGDLFVLDSFGYRLRIDNKIEDIFVEELKPEVKGTRVTFKINAQSKRHLSEVFEAFQVDPEEPDFDQTEVKIRLYNMGSIYVSRSQARRVLTGLSKFKRVILDFENVPTVGQAFADEIFRVFKNRHPEIEIVPVNMISAVKFMVDRVQKQ